MPRTLPSNPAPTANEATSHHRGATLGIAIETMRALAKQKAMATAPEAQPQAVYLLVDLRFELLNSECPVLDLDANPNEALSKHAAPTNLANASNIADSEVHAPP